jgi:predicted HTH transcriptional regulator
MAPQKLKELIAKGESTTLEFKRKTTTPEKFAKEISALANTKGGWLLVGVDDDGKIVGVHSEKAEISVIETSCEFFIDPPVAYEIEVIEVKRKEVVAVYIPESTEKPHHIEVFDTKNNKTLKRSYIRIGEKSVIASREMYRLMTYRTNNSPLTLSIGDKERRLFRFLEKNEKATVKYLMIRTETIFR